MSTVATHRSEFRVICARPAITSRTSRGVSGQTVSGQVVSGGVISSRTVSGEAARWLALAALAIAFFAVVVGVGLLAGKMADSRSFTGYEATIPVVDGTSYSVDG